MNGPITASEWSRLSIKMIESASNGDFESVNHCLDRGAYMYKRDYHCRTIFMYAAHFGFVDELARLEARRGVHSNDFMHDADENDWRMLHFAAAEGHMDVIKWLLRNHVDYNLCNIDQCTALDVALIHNKFHVAKLISAHIVREKKRLVIYESEQWRVPHVIVEEDDNWPLPFYGSEADTEVV